MAEQSRITAAHQAPRYTTSQATKFRDPEFKQKLAEVFALMPFIVLVVLSSPCLGLQEYGCDEKLQAGKLRCMLMNDYYSTALVCASHLFKYSWRDKVKATLGFENINDSRNGLLLLKYV
jgi:hypothetical protein